MDIRTSLGLPQTATDEQVERYLAEIRAQALGNLVGPKGFTGVAQDGRAVVFESFSDQPPGAFLPRGVAESFDGEVEHVTVSPSGSGSRVQVRVVKDGEPVDPMAPGDPTRTDEALGIETDGKGGRPRPPADWEPGEPGTGPGV